MTTKNQFYAVIKKTKRWFIGWIEEIPGVNAQGKTLGELRQNLKEALIMVIDANKSIARETVKSTNGYRRELLNIRIPA